MPAPEPAERMITPLKPSSNTTGQSPRGNHALLPWAWHLAGVLSLFLPLALLAWEAHRLLFLSNQHAHLVAKALLVLDRGRVELIGFVYPPLPFLLLLPWPHPFWASLLAALMGSAVAWVVLGRMVRAGFAPWQSLLTLGSAMLTPAALYLSTQALSHVLMLLLLVLTWFFFLRFVRDDYTQAGFISGMLLGLAFFVNHHALGFALGYGLAAPFFLRERTPGRILATMFVLLFPVVWAVGIWMYVNWVFTDNPLQFLHHPESSLFVYGRALLEEPIVGWPLALRAIAQDLLATPLYPLVLLLVLRYHPKRIGVYLFPLLLITTVRAWGMVYEPAFARGTLLLIALAGMPGSMPRAARLWVVLGGLLTLASSHIMGLSGEARAWQAVLLHAEPRAQALEEMDIARYLRGFPPQRVLLDDRGAYRLVARTGSARPFLLPADAAYPFALSNPARFVDALVVPTRPMPHVGGPMLNEFVRHPPEGFTRARAWPHWQLYLRQGLSMPTP